MTSREKVVSMMNQSGKGGSFVTKRNPFPIMEPKGGAPSLAEISGVGAALDALLNRECALIIGRTRDGGALVLTILDGEHRHRTYCSTVDELDEAITAIFETYKRD